jgi:hypothetical protein
MWRNRFVTGSVPLYWEWEVVKTPKEWWWDYVVKHPDYDPRVLDMEKGIPIYGSQFTWFKENFSKERAEDEEGEYASFFMDNYFGESYKYLVVLKRYKPELSRRDYNLYDPRPRYPFYDPMVEAPQAYLYFCRLSRLLDMGWSAKRVINEVMKFADRYGPPWHATYVKLFTPPFGRPPEYPLTVDRILWESQNMASAVEAYQLLSELNEDVRATRRLKEHMAKVLSRQDEYEVYYNLTREYSGYTLSDWDTGTRPNLDTEVDVAQAAIAFVMGSVNEGLRMTDVKPEVTSKLEKDNSAAGIWAPKYTFDSLLGAMWLQFYLQVLDKGRLRECANENCRRFFPLSRSDKEYCSKECGVKQYMRDHSKQRKEAQNERPHNQER